MAANPEMMAEAQRRGLLPADKSALYDEAVRRGLIAEQKPAAVGAGELIRGIPRQVGLAGRYAVEGALALPATLANAVNVPLNAGLRAAGSDFQFPEQNQNVSAALTQAGLPEPQGANERVIGDASRLLAGGGAMIGGAKALSRGATGLTQAVLGTTAANPSAQAASAVGAGAAGGSVREAGGGPWEQFAAALVGGIAAPYAAGKIGDAAQSAASAVRRKLAPLEVEQQVRIVFERSGVNWGELSAKARQSLVEDAQAAVYSGQQLDNAALRRLADYRSIGATPLRGDITQDPGTLTRQRNLAKTQANMAAPVGPNLSDIQNQNAKTVLSTLDDLSSSSDDAFTTGQRVIGSVQATDDAAKAAENALYTQARESAGQNIPLQRAGFVNSAFEKLARENKDPFLPAEIRSVLNNISKGQTVVNGQTVDTPFDVSTIDKLKTMLATASRNSSDGNVRSAIAIVRNSLEDVQPAPILPTRSQTVPATGAQTDAINQVSALPEEALRLLDTARAAARSRRNWQESLPFIEDALGGSTPDKFVQKHIIGGSVENLQGIKKLAGSSDVLRDSVRKQLVGYILKRGNADADVTRFSSKGMEDGLNALGGRKLRMWFSSEEVTQIKSAVRVAKYSQSQPIGSAVGNSNTGAVLISKSIEALQKLAQFVPAGEALISKPLQAVTVGAQARQLKDVGGVLAIPRPSQAVQPYGLAAAALIPGRDQDRRD